VLLHREANGLGREDRVEEDIQEQIILKAPDAGRLAGLSGIRSFAKQTRISYYEDRCEMDSALEPAKITIVMIPTYYSDQCTRVALSAA
jgi:hypothetical protein